MSAWAYRCHPCAEDGPDWFVSQLDVEQLGPDVRIVRVRVGHDWKCALLDRGQSVVVEDQLLRSVIASDEADCPECAERLAAESIQSTGAMESESSADAGAESPDLQTSAVPGESGPDAAKLLAAAVSLQGQRFVVVVCPMTLLLSPGEADMAIEDLQPYFGGVPVVLMAQRDDGSARYYGDSQLTDRLADIPIDKMPWKEYAVG